MQLSPRFFERPSTSTTTTKRTIQRERGMQNIASQSAAPRRHAGKMRRGCDKLSCTMHVHVHVHVYGGLPASRVVRDVSPVNANVNVHVPRKRSTLIATRTAA